MWDQDVEDRRVLVRRAGTTEEELQEAARGLLASRRQGNWTWTADLLDQAFLDAGLTRESAGTTRDEMQRFLVEDCRRQLESALHNWRLTADDSGSGKDCFAMGILVSLMRGGLQPEDHGISDIELERIKRSVG